MIILVIFNELEMFLMAAEANDTAAVDGWDALVNIKVCNGALRSLSDGRVVEVENGEEHLKERMEQAIESDASMLLVRR